MWLPRRCGFYFRPKTCNRAGKKALCAADLDRQYSRRMEDVPVSARTLSAEESVASIAEKPVLPLN